MNFSKEIFQKEIKFLNLITLEEESFPNQKRFFVVRNAFSFFGNYRFSTKETKAECETKQMNNYVQFTLFNVIHVEIFVNNFWEFVG